MFDEPDLESILAPLNPAQRVAVETIEGPLLILAGPGSGKTRVITHRIAYMIASGIDSRNIVALTFTNKAADEMKSRLENLSPGHRAWTGTFHRFCSRLLRVYAPQIGLSENFTIYDTGDSRKLFKQSIAESDLDLRHYSLETISSEISNLKSAGVLPGVFEPRPGNYLQRIVSQVYPVYQKLLQLANGVDFDDLLMLAGQLLTENEDLRHSLDERYAYMMVDEYQDTNLAQYRLIRLLNSLRPNLAVTGDPDQSIYGWRGATINNILEFERDYKDVKVVKLEQNYRSTKAILHVADQLIANNLKRKAKHLQTDNSEGEPVTLIAYMNPEQEANEIAEQIAHAVRTGKRKPSDFAIFYRTNALSRSLEHYLRLHGVPYQVVKGLEFYQRREIKDVLAYAHLLNNPSDSVAFERVINIPTRGIGDKTVDKIRRFAIDSGIAPLEAARKAGEIATIAKGTATKILRFVTLFDEIAEHRERQVTELFQKIVDLTGYREWLIEDGSEEGHERANNVEELIAAAAEFDRQHPDDGGLETFLEQAALVNDTDAWESTSDFVTMLTIHSSKGLEFKCVYIIGLEDGILPHERSNANDDEIEEERRLLFVGITRAEEGLQLSRCQSRFRKGGYWPCIASRFLMELPRAEMRVVEPRTLSDFGNEDAWAQDLDPWLRDGIPTIDVNGDQVQEKPATFLKAGPVAFPRLVTAAELARDQEAAVQKRFHPELFKVGMRVDHPDYGIGVIVDISGSGIKKTGTVDFMEYGKRRFRLSHAPLAPAED
jgi:DNA helicase II / ATP-dependent DNA helicase PcrA